MEASFQKPSRPTNDLDLDQVSWRFLISETDWRNAFPILHAFRPSLTEDNLIQRRESLLNRGYQLLGLYDNESLVGVAGIQILPHILRDQELRLHDLAVAPLMRSRGYGAILLRRVEEFARDAGCSRIILYSRNENERAHGFYRQQGYKDYGQEFSLELH